MRWGMSLEQWGMSTAVREYLDAQLSMDRPDPVCAVCFTAGRGNWVSTVHGPAFVCNLCEWEGSERLTLEQARALLAVSKVQNS